MSIPESELSYGSILTLTGENAEINGKLNNKPINFTHIAIGDANDVYVQPSRTQTTLVNEITRIPVTGMEMITPSEPDGVPQLKVWAKIPDDIVDIAVREFAAVATFDGNSYLHAVGNSVRIPILSGSNNGGEVNDIFVEMTFAVTSLEPILMIDPAIVTATRKYVDEQLSGLISNSQFQAYDANRIYKTGETCTTESNGEVKVWQMYAGPNLTCKGKDPTDPINRHEQWPNAPEPWWWVPYTGNTPGQMSGWLSDTIPEEAVLENEVDLNAKMYWRLAARWPELVSGVGDAAIINTRDILGRYVRTADGASYQLNQTHGDAIRNITGLFSGGNNFTYAGSEGNGAIRIINKLVQGESLSRAYLSETYSVYRGIDFDANRVVPTASQNQPVTTIENKIVFV
ncbi:phage tail protein [Vibrio sp. La 4.2.2]|uniref:phage tail-collar fiber domain-containing protein n=1 Tax=Vibrio sp. La 4.2.2 TaxID=2998830 RepID=UPI0022CE3649|nr:phage tail protein [Vibrio sp. La 4.2.2]MDA0109020.1 phage tail protein [Vibrio sp. La 4.2.2]